VGKIAAIGEELKHLAISRNIPIIQTVQFNREAEKNKKFGLETIAGSDAISQLGSIILAMGQADDPYKDVRRKIEIIKNREGGLCEFEINYRFSPPDFTEISALADSNLTEEEIRI
jgi:replicative DNA helicase